MDANALILGQLQGINARLDAIQAEGSERGRMLWQEVNDQGKTLVAISHRLGTVEKSMEGAQPTLKQFTDMQAKAVGAGWLGRKLMLIGTGLLGAAGWLYSVRDTIWQWFAGK